MKKRRTTPLHYQQADHRHPVARGDAPTRSTVNPYALLLDILNAREKQNTLPFLTPQRAQELFTAWRRGEMSDVQLTWDQMEEFDETLATIRAARLGALAEMEWHIEIDATAVGDDPAQQQEAEAQQATLTRHLNAVENLDEALLHLGMADFRGVAALEITGNATHYKWEPIEPWCLARPARRGPWFYNADASPTPARLEELDLSVCILREASPIDLPAMFLIIAKHHSLASWDAFLDVFGNPSIFLEMPPNTDEQRAMEYDAKVQQIIGEGRGTIPNGTKFQTVETSQTDADAFTNRAKWCNEQLITLALGGLLTVATAPDSGTLAGNAHADSLARLAALSARSISATVQRQFCIPILRAQHPDRPILVRFILAPEEQEDKAAQAQLIATLAAAGYHPTAETVSELIGFEVDFTPPAPPAGESGGAFPLANATNAQEAPETLENARTDTLPQNAPSPSADYRQNSAGGHSGAEAGEIYNVQGTKYNLEDSRGDAAPGSPNRTTQDAAPLTEAELAAIQSIGKLSLDDLVRTDAATLAEGMLAAVEGDGQEETELENACNPNQKRSSDGRFASGTGASIHARKGGRSSNGNPKGSPNKTNTPRKLPPNATQGDKERELAKAISEKRTRGGQPRTVAGVTVTVSGTHHQQDGHKQDPNATPENMAKALTRDPHKDEDGVIGRYKNLKTVADPNGKGSRISVTALTQRRQSEHKKKKAPKQDSGAVQDR